MLTQNELVALRAACFANQDAAALIDGTIWTPEG